MREGLDCRTSKEQDFTATPVRVPRASRLDECWNGENSTQQTAPSVFRAMAHAGRIRIRALVFLIMPTALTERAPARVLLINQPADR